LSFAVERGDPRFEREDDDDFALSIPKQNRRSRVKPVARRCDPLVACAPRGELTGTMRARGAGKPTPEPDMSKILRGLAAGYGAKKLGGGCFSTVLIFILLWWLLGNFGIFQ
jgi:hypothetical protein